MPSKVSKTRTLAKSCAPQMEAAVLLQRAWRRHCAAQEMRHRSRLFQRRTNIAGELLTTERTYVTNLEILVNSFLLPLEQVSIKILRKDLQTNLHLLGSIVKVIVSYHAIIYNKVKERLDDWSSATKLGDIFMEMSSYLKAYTQYVTHYQPVLRILRARKADEALQNTLSGLVTPECQGKGLKDFLIMPIQRIPRYNMMLEDLLRKTPASHCDYENLQAASKKVIAVCEHVEETSDHASRLEKKMELAARIVFPKGDSTTLALPHRKFLWEGDALVTTTFPAWKKNLLMKRPIRMFAFSDLFVFCDSTRNDLYKVILSVDLELIQTFRAVSSVGAKEADAMMFHLQEGECKVEELAPHNCRQLESFFLELSGAVKETVNGQKRGDRAPAAPTDSPDQRRTIQIQRQTSAVLPKIEVTNHRDRADTLMSLPRPQSEQVPSPKSSSRFPRALSSKALRRTLSAGRFSKEKITKSISKDELSTVAENPMEVPLTRARTTERLRDLSDMVKGKRKGESSPSLRKHQKTTV